MESEEVLKVLKSIPKQNENNENDERYNRLRYIIDFLNCVVHFKSKPIKGKDTALDIAKLILQDDNISKIDEKVIDKMCVEYITILYEIFKINCMNKI